MSGPPPVAEFRRQDPTRVTVWVDGTRYTLTVTTHGLLEALAGGNPYDVVPAMFDTGAQRQQWAEHLFDPRTRFDLHDATAVAGGCVEYLTGIPMTTAVALAGWLADEWVLIYGYHHGRGVDLLALSPAALFSALYAWVVEHRFAGDRAEADQVLFPHRPPSRAAAQAAVDADGGAGFLAAFTAAGSGQLPGAG